MDGVKSENRLGKISTLTRGNLELMRVVKSFRLIQSKEIKFWNSRNQTILNTAIQSIKNKPKQAIWKSGVNLWIVGNS